MADGGRERRTTRETAGLGGYRGSHSIFAYSGCSWSPSSRWETMQGRGRSVFLPLADFTDQAEHDRCSMYAKWVRWLALRVRLTHLIRFPRSSFYQGIQASSSAGLYPAKHQPCIWSGKTVLEFQTTAASGSAAMGFLRSPIRCVSSPPCTHAQVSKATSRL